MNLIYDQFLENCKKIPTANAIINDNQTITYQELYAGSYTIANYLYNNKELSPDSVIGILGKKCDKSIAAILGIMMAGMSYLPIDATYPKERINYIVENSHVNLLFLIDTEPLDNGIKQVNIDKILSYDPIQADALPNINVKTTDRCYVIYTSGSTANKPNGVMVSHASILNTVQWRNQFYHFSQDDCILLFSSLSFDSSVEDIFCALSSGAQLVIADDKKKVDPRYIKKIIYEHSVTHFMLIPSMYAFFLQTIPDCLHMLKVVVLAGEDFDAHLIHEHYAKCKNVNLFNEYGPTENSVCSTCAFLTPNSDVNIGSPINNVQYFLVGDDNEISDTYGELYLAGSGLALGYINDKKLTQEKFIRHAGFQYETVYRTGDIVACSSGTLIYKGRLDAQVKINGVRINLQELMSICKNKVPQIKDTYAMGYRNNGMKIALFYTADSDIDENEIKSLIYTQLPHYMIPSFIKRLVKFPTLPNLKIDINHLRNMIY